MSTQLSRRGVARPMTVLPAPTAPASGSADSASSNVSTQNITLNGATAVGDVILMVVMGAGAGVIGGSGAGATWSVLQTGPTAGGSSCTLVKGVTPTAGQTVVTATSTVAEKLVCAAVIVRGAGSGVVNSTVAGASSTASPATIGSITSTAANQLAVGVACCFSGSNFGSTAVTQNDGAWTLIRLANAKVAQNQAVTIWVRATIGASAQLLTVSNPTPDVVTWMTALCAP